MKENKVKTEVEQLREALENQTKQMKKSEKIFTWANIKRRIFIIFMYFLLTFLGVYGLYLVGKMG